MSGGAANEMCSLREWVGVSWRERSGAESTRCEHATQHDQGYDLRILKSDKGEALYVFDIYENKCLKPTDAYPLCLSLQTSVCHLPPQLYPPTHQLLLHLLLLIQFQVSGDLGPRERADQICVGAAGP